MGYNGWRSAELEVGGQNTPILSLGGGLVEVRGNENFAKGIVAWTGKLKRKKSEGGNLYLVSVLEPSSGVFAQAVGSSIKEAKDRSLHNYAVAKSGKESGPEYDSARKQAN